MFKLTLRELFLIITLAGIGTAWWLDRTAMSKTHSARVESFRKANAALAESLRRANWEATVAPSKSSIDDEYVDYLYELVAKIDDRLEAGKKVDVFWPCTQTLSGRIYPVVSDDEGQAQREAAESALARERDLSVLAENLCAAIQQEGYTVSIGPRGCVFPTLGTPAQYSVELHKRRPPSTAPDVDFPMRQDSFGSHIPAQ